MSTKETEMIQSDNQWFNSRQLSLPVHHILSLEGQGHKSLDYVSITLGKPCILMAPTLDVDQSN